MLALREDLAGDVSEAKRTPPKPYVSSSWIRRRFVPSASAIARTWTKRPLHVKGRRWTAFAGWLLTAAVATSALAERLDGLEPRNAREAPPPSSWQTRMDYSREATSRSIVLPALADAESATESGIGEPGQPQRIGVGRQLPAADRGDLAPTLTWKALTGGGRAAAFSVRSPGAGAVRVALRAALPRGAVLRFFVPGDPQRRYPVLKQTDFGGPHPDGDPPTSDGVRTRWSPTVPGDSLGIEIEIPPSAHEGDVSLHVVDVSHVHRAPAKKSDADDGLSKNTGTCEPVQAACRDLPACPNSAVVRLSFTDAAGDSYLCTGTAVNSARARDLNLDAPYLLTAAHCIESQATADTVETRWNYAYETCEASDADPDFTALYGGAELIVRDPDSDGSLLRLRDALPNSACLAGWNSDGGWTEGTDVTSLHHPGGDPKQWAGGSLDTATVIDGVDVIPVTWTEGLTTGGSSGAGLFTTVDGSDVLIGTLYGGPACTAAQPVDYYGRFDRFFDHHAGAHLEHTTPPAEDDHGDTLATATPAVPGSETEGDIEDGADADVFRIVVLRRGTLTVYTTGPLDTVGRLKREDGSTIAFNDDFDHPTDTNFRIEADVARGIYYVKVSGYDETAIGHYRLHVEFTAAEAKILVPFFLAASALDSDDRQGFVRVVNHSDRAGTVRIMATDDAGTSHAVTLDLDPAEVQALNSQDLEQGNDDKGLSGGTDVGTGDWRLEFDSDLALEVGAYVRTTDGFLTAVHDVVPIDEFTGSYYVSVFNPASNMAQRSRLRLINPDPENAVDVTITGRDDAGFAGQSAVELQLAAGSARTLSAVDLEDGGEELTGALGDGSGKWRLFVKSDEEIRVVNLLDNETGNLSNLSTPGRDNFDQ